MSGIEQQANLNAALESALDSSRLGAVDTATAVPLDLEEVTPKNPEVSSVVDSERKKALELETKPSHPATEIAQPARLEERVERLPEESRPRTKHPIARAAYRNSELIREEREEKREEKPESREITKEPQENHKADLERAGRNVIREGNLRVSNQKIKESELKEERSVAKDAVKAEPEASPSTPPSVSIPVALAEPLLESKIESSEPALSEPATVMIKPVLETSVQLESETDREQEAVDPNLDYLEVATPESDTLKEESPRAATIVTETVQTQALERDQIDTKSAPVNQQTASRETHPHIIAETPEIPRHLIEKLNLLNQELNARQEQEKPVSINVASNSAPVTAKEEKPPVRERREQAKLTPLPSVKVAADAKVFGTQQMHREQLSLDQALKLDLSQAQIGKTHNNQPLSFRGHSIGSGTPLDRLITHIADFIKRLEMRLLQFLTRRYQDKKKRPKQVVKARTKEEEDELLLASFSSSLARNRKKRYRLLSALERFQLLLKRD